MKTHSRLVFQWYMDFLTSLQIPTSYTEIEINDDNDDDDDGLKMLQPMDHLHQNSKYLHWRLKKKKKKMVYLKFK